MRLASGRDIGYIPAPIFKAWGQTSKVRRAPDRETHVANTKNITDRTERKAKKRGLRTALKAEFTKLTKDLKRRFRNGETKGLRKFLSEQKSA